MLKHNIKQSQSTHYHLWQGYANFYNRYAINYTFNKSVLNGYFNSSWKLFPPLSYNLKIKLWVYIDKLQQGYAKCLLRQYQ